MYIEGEIPNVVTSNGNCNNNGFGNGWEGLIGLALVASLFGGGWGFGGGFGGGRGGYGAGNLANLRQPTMLHQVLAQAKL